MPLRGAMHGSLVNATVASPFPLAFSGNGRYLTSAGSPLLIREASSWGLIQALTLANAKDYIDRRVAEGVNAFKVSAIANDADVFGDYAHQAPAWNGIGPFTSPGD